MVSPPDNIDTALCTWYLDRSLLDGEWLDYRATGFGVAIVDRDGSLLAFGLGCPPTWCATAAAAETWALVVALRLSPYPPQLRTDCLSLLTSALDAHRACGANRSLARAWSMIRTALDGDTAVLVRDGRLVWLPAHQTTAAIGVQLLSNKRRFSAIDWRANRLVDALAKLAASERRAPVAIIRLLKSAKAAALHAAALLGQMTHAANNHRIIDTRPDGSQVTRVVRDSQDPEARPQRDLVRAPKQQPCPPSPEMPLASRMLPELAVLGRKRPSPSAWSRAGKMFAKRMRIQEDVATQRRVDAIASTLVEPPADRPSASQRILDVHR